MLSEASEGRVEGGVAGGRAGVWVVQDCLHMRGECGHVNTGHSVTFFLSAPSVTINTSDVRTDVARPLYSTPRTMLVDWRLHGKR